MLRPPNGLSPVADCMASVMSADFSINVSSAVRDQNADVGSEAREAVFADPLLFRLGDVLFNLLRRVGTYGLLHQVEITGLGDVRIISVRFMCAHNDWQAKYASHKKSVSCHILSRVNEPRIK